MQIRRIGAGLAAAALLMTLASCGKDEQEAAKFERADQESFVREMSDLSSFAMDNGIVVYLQEERTNEQIAVEFLYRAGFMDEPKGKAQLAHVAEHLAIYCASGEFGPDESYRTVQDHKGMLSAETVADFSHIGYIVTAENLELALSIEAQRMAGISCNEDIRQREMGKVMKELNDVLSNPKGSLSKYAMMALNQTLYYGERFVSIREGAQRISNRDAQEFVRENFRPDDLVIVIVGNVDKAVAEALVRKHLESMPRRPHADTQRKPVSGDFNATWDIDGKALYLVSAGPYDSARDRLILTMFGSYLHQVLMTSQDLYTLCRSVYASNQIYRVADVPFFVFAEPGMGRTNDEIRPVLRQYVDSAVSSLDDSRVEAIKASLVSFVTSTSLKKDSPDYPLMHHQVIGQEALNVGMRHALREGKTTEEFVTEINSVTADEFRAVVARYVNSSRLQEITYTEKK